MALRVVIAGFGAVGRALAPLLVARGDTVRIAQQHRPTSLGEAVKFVQSDLRRADHATRATAGSDVVICTVGIPYRSVVYVRDWPRDARAARERRFRACRRCLATP